MIQKFIVQEKYSKLLIFFAGWGANETPFKDYRPAHHDYMICYDYRDLSFDPQVLNGYERVTIIGWSMGVWAASQVMGRLYNENYKLPIIRAAIAINGTPYPIDEERGIPAAIYHGTLEGLTSASLHKFLRRMCANSAEFKKFLAITPRRPLKELREELVAIEEMYTTQTAYPFSWDEIVISTEDRIIPPENQKRVWTGRDNPYMSSYHSLLTIETSHYDSELFDIYLEKEWIND